MAILKNTNINNKNKIIESFFPFSEIEKIDGIIIGNDLDSLLSASFIKDKFNLDIVGFYDYNSIWYDSTITDFKVKLKSSKYLCLDLDIYHENIPSIGHHILEYDSSDLLPNHKLTLNPNFIRGINHSQFWRKYPLSTIHFLVWLFNQTYNNNTELLIWLADSSFINAQRYSKNVDEWIKNFFNDISFKALFPILDTLQFEKDLFNNIVTPIKKIKICDEEGQIKSKYLNLSGSQCQWSDPNAENSNIKLAFNFINSITGWVAPTFPSLFSKIVGKRLSKDITGIFNLDNFLINNNVFSYVFPNKNRINYTILIV